MINYRYLRSTIRHRLRQLFDRALFITHAKEEGFAFADKIAIMQAGKIVQLGSAKQLYNYPCSRYVADFMGQSNYLKVQVQDDFNFISDFGVIRSEHKITACIGDVLFLLIRPEHLLMRLDEKGSGEVIDVLFLGGSFTA